MIQTDIYISFVMSSYIFALYSVWSCVSTHVDANLYSFNEIEPTLYGKYSNPGNSVDGTLAINFTVIVTH